MPCAENSLFFSVDVVFHTPLEKYTEGLPPVVEHCTMFLEYYKDRQCGMLGTACYVTYIFTFDSFKHDQNVKI